MSEENKYGIWEYMSEQHDITLLESEVHEIIRLAQAEMELPDEEEITTYADEQYLMIIGNVRYTKEAAHDFIQGANWALGKVRNPYPKQINPIKK